MRKLVMLRGPQGAGKTTFIKNQELEAFALTPDDLRLLLAGITMDEAGRIGINQGKEKKVWEELDRVLEDKMARGEFIVFDATFQRSKDFTPQLARAKKHRYEVYCVDFSHCPEAQAQANNLKRPDYKQVPPEAISLAYQRLRDNHIPAEITSFSADEFVTEKLKDRLAEPIIDLNAYHMIHHIGDIQGCYDPLAEYLAHGFHDDEFYIFVGDYLDRGSQNGEVIRFLVDEVMNRPNVILLWGNHETHIQRYALGLPPISREFEFKTLPQLQAANFTRAEANRLCNRLRDCVAYHYRGRHVFVNHAGLPRLPQDLVLLPSTVMWRGVGGYDFAIDQAFTDQMKDTTWLQIHGHRNKQELPIMASDKSFNLEGKVEFGGALRIITLSDQGDFTPIEISTKPVTPSSASQAAGTISRKSQINLETLESLRQHPLIKTKSFASYPHITSYNFAREAFKKGIWDKVSLTARGLFIDDQNHIVARSYNKFFNLEERPETQLRNLQRSLHFPLTLYVKENGFLGILGFDEQTGKLFFASKSTPESEFAGWFYELAHQAIPADKWQYLTDLLREQNLSLVFEVVDPQRDPHIIAYEQPLLILLDAISRTEQFSRLDYAELQNIAHALNLKVKEQAMCFTSWDEFKTWYQALMAGDDERFAGRHIEGYVAEDAAGFHVKIKLPYYSFWKAMRSVKDRVLKQRELGESKPIHLLTPEAQKFYDWLLTKPTELLQQNIIVVRQQYLIESK